MRSKALGQLCDAGSHCHRIAAQGAGLVNVSIGRNMTHDGCAGTVGSYRQTATDYFSVGDDIRLDVVITSCTGETHPETADDLIKNEQRAIFCALLKKVK